MVSNAIKVNHTKSWYSGNFFGIVVNDVLIIGKCSLKCKCLIWDQNRKIFIGVFIKVSCDPNMPHLLAVSFMNN